MENAEIQSTLDTYNFLSMHISCKAIICVPHVKGAFNTFYWIILFGYLIERLEILCFCQYFKIYFIIFFHIWCGGKLYICRCSFCYSSIAVLISRNVVSYIFGATTKLEYGPQFLQKSRNVILMMAIHLFWQT